MIQVAAIKFKITQINIQCIDRIILKIQKLELVKDMVIAMNKIKKILKI